MLKDVLINRSWCCKTPSIRYLGIWTSEFSVLFRFSSMLVSIAGIGLLWCIHHIMVSCATKWFHIFVLCFWELCVAVHPWRHCIKKKKLSIQLLIKITFKIFMEDVLKHHIQFKCIIASSWISWLNTFCSAMKCSNDPCAGAASFLFCFPLWDCSHLIFAPRFIWSCWNTLIAHLTFSGFWMVAHVRLL